MILYRAIGAYEMALFTLHETIAPSMESIFAKNSWNTALVTFFGTANNALHWANPGNHDFVVALEIDSERVKAGWGIYPDFDEQISIAEMLEGMMKGKVPEHTLLKVREYGVPFYNDQEARFVDCMTIDWEDKYKSCFPRQRVSLVVKNNYDDVIERLVKKP